MKEKMNIYNYLDLSPENIKQVVDYIEKYIINTHCELEDICGDKVGNAIIYVDFENYLDIIKIKDVTIQDTIHHIDMVRDSQVVKWILETDLFEINKSLEEIREQAQIIRREQRCY